MKLELVTAHEKHEMAMKFLVFEKDVFMGEVNNMCATLKVLWNKHEMVMTDKWHLTEALSCVNSELDAPQKLIASLEKSISELNMCESKAIVMSELLSQSWSINLLQEAHLESEQAGIFVLSQF